jgi:hypothetical protein
MKSQIIHLKTIKSLVMKSLRPNQNTIIVHLNYTTIFAKKISILFNLFIQIGKKTFLPKYIKMSRELEKKLFRKV